MRSLLAGNGFGTGATKLMRPFYERVVAMSYLAAYPGGACQTIHWVKKEKTD
jgi:hypothetical protein